MFRGLGKIRTTTKSFCLPVFSISPKHLILHHTINRSRIHSSSTQERSIAIANIQGNTQQPMLGNAFLYCIFATVRNKLHNVLWTAWHLYFIRLVCVIRVYALINWRKATRVMGEVSAVFLCCLDLSSEGVGKKEAVLWKRVCLCLFCVHVMGLCALNVQALWLCQDMMIILFGSCLRYRIYVLGIHKI